MLFTSCSNFGSWSLQATLSALLLKFVVAILIRAGVVFAAFFAIALDVAVARFFDIVAVASLTGLLNVVLALVAHLPPRTKLVSGWFMIVAGLAITAGSRSYSLVYFSWILLSSGSFVCYAAIQSYVSLYVPSERIGRMTSILELSFSMAGLLGLPLVGFILENGSWATLFLVLLILALPSGLSFIHFVIVTEANGAKSSETLVITDIVVSNTMSENIPVSDLQTELTASINCNTVTARSQVPIICDGPSGLSFPKTHQSVAVYSYLVGSSIEVTAGTSVACPDSYETDTRESVLVESTESLTKSLQATISEGNTNKSEEHASVVVSEIPIVSPYATEITDSPVMVSPCVPVITVSQAILMVFADRVGLVCIALAVLVPFAIILLAGAFGQWLVFEHHFSVQQVGSVALILGAGEVLGNIVFAVVSHAVGLKNALQLGMLFWIFGLVLIAIFQSTQFVFAVACVGYCSVCSEFMMIALVSTVCTLAGGGSLEAPDDRNPKINTDPNIASVYHCSASQSPVFIQCTIGFLSLGQFLAAQFVTMLYDWGGLSRVAEVAAGALLVALMAFGGVFRSF